MMVGRKRSEKAAEIKVRNMTAEQNMLSCLQDINLSRRTQLTLHVVILTARWNATHMYFQDVWLSC